MGQADLRGYRPAHQEGMETADDEFLAATLDDMDRSVKAGKPFFIWHNTTRMHIWTHLPPKYVAMVNKKGLYGAGMTQLDDNVGVMLKKLDDLGIADNTIVIFTSDNGAEAMSWPDGGTTPFRGEKNTSWEGGYRIPFVIRWPGVIKPGTVVNDITAHEDLAAHAHGGSRRARRQGETACRLPGRQHDLQSSSRWLQLDAVFQGRGGGRAPPRVPVLDG